MTAPITKQELTFDLMKEKFGEFFYQWMNAKAGLQYENENWKGSLQLFAINTYDEAGEEGKVVYIAQQRNDRVGDSFQASDLWIVFPDKERARQYYDYWVHMHLAAMHEFSL